MEVERERTCCFTGHRSSKLPWHTNEGDIRCVELKRKLREALREEYEGGIRHFICGMAPGSDMYFAEEVLRLREELPDITLEAAVPYEEQSRGLSPWDKRRYERVLSACDKVTVVSREYWTGCMQKRNVYMVDRSAVIIAVFGGGQGGTFNTMRYALKKGLKLVEISP